MKVEMRERTKKSNEIGATTRAGADAVVWSDLYHEFQTSYLDEHIRQMMDQYGWSPTVTIREAQEVNDEMVEE